MTAEVQPLHEPPASGLPANPEVEAALLGAVLTNNHAFESVSDIVAPEHFFEPVHGRIFEAIGTLIDRGETASPLTLKKYFEKDEALEPVGGGQYLFDLVSCVISIINVKDYARDIADLARRRALIEIGHDLISGASVSSLDVTAGQVQEETEERLFALAAGNIESRGAAFHVALDGALREAEAAYRHDGEITGLSTGLPALDRRMGGLMPQDQIIVAGRPGMGKTALAATIAHNVAVSGSHAMFFSLEMAREQIARRILAYRTGISGWRIRNGNLGQPDWVALVNAKQELHGLPLHIDDSDTLTVAQIRSRARRYKRRHGLGLIVIDYLQLIEPGQDAARQNPTAQITEISRDLKRLAKGLDVPVVALSQLSRQVEGRDDKRPLLSDLRESGAIEQNADIVLFCYRHEYYLEKTEPQPGSKDYQEKHAVWTGRMQDAKGQAQAIIAKNRHGPTKTAHLVFDADATWFRDPGDERQEGMDL